MSEGFDFFNVEVGAKIIAESISETDEIGEGKLFFEDFVFDADEDFLLGGATREVSAGGTMAGAGKTEGLFAIDGVFFTGFEDGASIIIVFNVFVEGDGDAA